jgi:hypothetical protein
MLKQPVADFFQEDSDQALRARVQWLQEHMGLDDAFLAKVLRTEEAPLALWRAHGVPLPGSAQRELREVWDMTIHVLSFLNFDTGRARRMLEHTAPAALQGAGHGQAPLWANGSIKTFLESHGAAAVDEVIHWVTAFRFGAPSLTPEQELPCPSTQD